MHSTLVHNASLSNAHSSHTITWGSLRFNIQLFTLPNSSDTNLPIQEWWNAWLTRSEDRTIDRGMVLASLTNGSTVRALNMTIELLRMIKQLLGPIILLIPYCDIFYLFYLQLSCCDVFVSQLNIQERFYVRFPSKYNTNILKFYATVKVPIFFDQKLPFLCAKDLQNHWKIWSE